MRCFVIFGSVLMVGVTAILLPGCTQPAKNSSKLQPSLTANVGPADTNRIYLPTGQLLTPAGRQVDLPGMRPQALVLSPNQRLLVTAGKDQSLVFIDSASGAVIRKLPLSFTRSNPKKKEEAEKGQMSFAGLAFAPDGRHLYLSDIAGYVWRFPINETGEPGKPTRLQVPDSKTPKQDHELPAGLAISSDGQRLYVAGNLGNKLHELDSQSGKLLRSWDTGVAPQEVLLTSSKAYVSNRGGRRPQDNDHSAPAGKGTRVRVDETRHIANEGSVTVIDLGSGQLKTEILTELHSSGMALSPNGRYVVVANSGSDTLSVIDTLIDQVVEKIWTRQTPADLFGAQPNALVFDPNGKWIYVCNGSQNAVAVIQFEPEDNASKVTGLIPTGWFPGGIQFHKKQRTLCVANMRGIGSAKIFAPGETNQLNTKDFWGTISLVRVPSQRQLTRLTEQALLNIHYPKLAESRLPARPGTSPRPVPERVGEPSVFKHVIYVIKENRTYDQILGDMPEGNGSAELCIFGEKYTPNQHKIAREFVLLDNTYCSGVQSADGHQWTDSAIANEYMERQITSGTPRSYPGGKSEDGADALAWASSGFIWDNALKHGKTFRNYGEWMLTEAGWTDSKRKDSLNWRDYWKEYQTGSGELRLRSRPAIETLRPYSNTNTVGWDLKVPDVMRAAEFVRELRQFETNGGFPNLIILFLPNDHSGGARERYPTPGAQIADNDLALGQVVEALSHSRFWPETCLLAIQDDPQAGWDHVSGYRTACYLVSPYTKRRQTISTQYNQTSLMRTIELILGLPPMNHLDATATPMTDCFNQVPDFTPFKSVPNRVPLDTINPDPKQVSHPVLREDALASRRLPLEEVDRCPEDLLNRILWRSMKGPDAPYPQWAVKNLEEEEDEKD